MPVLAALPKQDSVCMVHTRFGGDPIGVWSMVTIIITCLHDFEGKTGRQMDGQTFL